MLRQGSLANMPLGAAHAGAGIPLGCGNESIVETAEAVADVVVVCSIGRRCAVGGIDGGKLGRTRSGKMTSAIYDAGPGWRGHTGAAKYIPAATVGGVVVIDPDPCIGVGVRGDVGHKALARR